LGKKKSRCESGFYIEFINFYLNNNTTIPFLTKEEIKRIAKIKTIALHFLFCYLANVENFVLGFTKAFKILIFF